MDLADTRSRKQKFMDAFAGLAAYKRTLAHNHQPGMEDRLNDPCLKCAINRILKNGDVLKAQHFL